MLRPIDPLGPREPTDQAELVRRASKVSPIKHREQHEDDAGSDGQHHFDQHHAAHEHAPHPEDLDAGTYDEQGRHSEDTAAQPQLPPAQIRHIDLSA